MALNIKAKEKLNVEFADMNAEKDLKPTPKKELSNFCFIYYMIF